MSVNAVAHPAYASGLRVIYNNRLIKRFQSIESFEPEERDLVIKVLDALIVKNGMESTLKSTEI